MPKNGAPANNNSQEQRRRDAKIRDLDALAAELEHSGNDICYVKGDLEDPGCEIGEDFWRQENAPILRDAAGLLFDTADRVREGRARLESRPCRQCRTIGLADLDTAAAAIYSSNTHPDDRPASFSTLSDAMRLFLRREAAAALHALAHFWGIDVRLPYLAPPRRRRHRRPYAKPTPGEPMPGNGRPFNDELPAILQARGDDADD